MIATAAGFTIKNRGAIPIQKEYIDQKMRIPYKPPRSLLQRCVTPVMQYRAGRGYYDDYRYDNGYGGYYNNRGGRYGGYWNRNNMMYNNYGDGYSYGGYGPYRRNYGSYDGYWGVGPYRRNYGYGGYGYGGYGYGGYGGYGSYNQGYG